MRPSPTFHRASALVLTLSALAVLSISAAYTLRRVSPRFQMASQAAAWQEARLAAESGIDVALADLSRNATGVEDGNWHGWQQTDGRGLIIPALSSTLNLANSLLSLLGGNVKVSAPIFLDNLQGVSPGNRPTNVDVQLWAVYPTPSPYYRWFRLRAMATCALPPTATSTFDSLEAPLRRFSLRQVRPQLRKDDVGTPMSLPMPSASRVIEVLVEPVLPFELAILTDQTLSLGTSGSWVVDSFDSRDPNKSGADGAYPGQASPRVQSHGNIASNAGRPGDALYGPLVSANGCVVRGAVATNGGDNPATDSHENVAGATRIDAAQVRDDFYREMKPVARPSSGILLPPPLLNLPYVAGDESRPVKYLVSGNLHSFRVAPYSGLEKGSLIIMVNGNLDIGSGTISIPPNVTVQIFVRGNVDFHNRPINQGGQAGQLQIYGEETHGDVRTLRAYGDAEICAAFYGPQYDVRLTDAVEWTGAVAARSFEMLGGGSGGFHTTKRSAWSAHPSATASPVTSRMCASRLSDESGAIVRAEMWLDAFGDIAHADLPAALLRDARHLDTDDAARRDRGKRCEIAADVEREAVHADPAAHADADRGDLLPPDPYARLPRAASGGDAIIGEQRDEHVFEAAEVTVQILSAHAQVEDRVADQLARSVIGGLPTAVRLHHGVGECAGIAQAGLIGRAADGVDRFVLEQQQLIGRGSVRRLARDDLFLQRQRVGKCDAAEPAN